MVSVLTTVTGGLKKASSKDIILMSLTSRIIVVKPKIGNRQIRQMKLRMSLSLRLKCMPPVQNTMLQNYSILSTSFAIKLQDQCHHKPVSSLQCINNFGRPLVA